MEKRVGNRGTERPDPGALQRTLAAVRRTGALVPRGVYRFATFEEADTWMTRTMARTHVSRSSTIGATHRCSAPSGRRSSIDAVTDWFARPVLHVSSVEASLRFYVERLGFTVAWRYEEDGRARAAQVDRGSCALILAEQWPEKVGKGLMFISLEVEPQTHDAEVAALDALRAEFEAHGLPVKDGHWGYRLLVVEDLDGNQLFFNYPNEA